jgi:transcriptional regulator of arginine metabolism
MSIHVLNTYAMPDKNARQSLIRRLLEKSRVENQAHLQRLLRADGVEATQATLSRDLRELGVLKGPAGYTLSDQGSSPAITLETSLDRALGEFLVGVRCGGNLVVLRTGPGHASALALELDRADLPGAIGTVAGDDTIFMAAATDRDAQRLLADLRQRAGFLRGPSGQRRVRRAAAV